jgi:DNA-binding transcriptional ArsR family regulator
LHEAAPGPYNGLVKPLVHPSKDDVTVEGILHALSDPVRARIFAEMAAAQCPRACSAFLKICDQPVPKSTLSQHFKVLREAGLIRSERRGVELQNCVRLDDLHERFGPLIAAIVEAHAAQNQRSKPKRSRARRQ